MLSSVQSKNNIILRELSRNHAGHSAGAERIAGPETWLSNKNRSNKPSDIYKVVRTSRVQNHAA